MQAPVLDFSSLPTEEPALPPDVLCYGHDKMLLYTRQMILGRLGCYAATVMSRSDYQAYLLEKPCRLVVICQTLSQQECDDAINFASESSADTRVLVLSSRMTPTASESRYTTLSAYDGPAAFAKTVFSML